MKKVALYIRVSSEEQVRIVEGSLVSQRNRLEEYVETQNRNKSSWGQITGVYIDEGKSAKDMNRSEFQRLLSDVKTGQVDLILATELSRISRSIQDFCELWELFKKHKTGFITLREQFDTTTAAGEMMVFNLINFAQFERKQTAERISANWVSRAKRGLWNGGTIPLGYERNPANKGKLLVNEKEAETVKKIFETFLKIGSVRKTCLELSNQGVYVKKYTNKHGLEKGGNHFTVPTLQRLLTSRAYLGLREMGVKKGEVTETKASWDAIVSESVFNQVQTRLTLNRNKRKPEEWKTHPFPLTELIRCGECGKHLGGKSGHGRNGKHFYYGHPRQIHSDGVTHLKRCQLENVRAVKTEEVILRSLQKIVSEPNTLNHWIDVYEKGNKTEIPALEGRVKTIETELSTQSNRLQNLMLRLSDLPKEIPADLIYKQIAAIQKKTKELEKSKQELVSQKIKLTANSVDRERLLYRLERTLSLLEKTPSEKKRPLYENLIQFAELHPTKIRLGLYAPAFPFSQTHSQDEKKPATAIHSRAGSCKVIFGAKSGT